jgi:hypothetical protein
VNRLIEISPECPVCKTHHSQTFAWEELYELLQDKESVSHFYCPRQDKSWPASREHSRRLAHIVAVFARLYKSVRQSQTDPGATFSDQK